MSIKVVALCTALLMLIVVPEITAQESEPFDRGHYVGVEIIPYLVKVDQHGDAWVGDVPDTLVTKTEFRVADNVRLSYLHKFTPWIGGQVGLEVISGRGSAAILLPFGARVFPYSLDWKEVRISPVVSGNAVWVVGITQQVPQIGSVANGIPRNEEPSIWFDVGFGIEFLHQIGLTFRTEGYGVFLQGESLFWPKIYLGYAF